MPLTAALSYIADKLGLPEGETIQIDCYLDEARELQAILSRWDGTTQWDHPASADVDLPIADYRFECLIDLIREHNLCIQFIDTYPCLKQGNMRVLISARRTARERLDRCEGTLGMVLARKASFQLPKIAQDASEAPACDLAPPSAVRPLQAHCTARE